MGSNLPTGGFDDWITIEEAAAYLAIPVRTLYRLAQRGQLPATKVGRTWRFKRSLLDAHLAAGAEPVPATDGGNEAEEQPAGSTASDQARLVDELTALADLSVRLSGVLEATEIAEFVCQRLRDAFDVDGVMILRLEHAGGEDVLLPVGWSAPGPPPQELRLRVGDTPQLDRVVTHGEPLTLADLPHATSGTTLDFVRRFGFYAGVMVPIFEAGRVWGTMALSTRAERTFSRLEIERLGAVAAQVGTALGNARLLAEARRWSEQLVGIEALSRQLNRSRSVQEVSDIVAREIGGLIDYDGLRLYLLQPDGETLEAVAIDGRVDHYADETPELLRLRLGEGLGGTIARSGIGEIIPDVLHDPRTADIAGSLDIDESMIVVPLSYEDEVLGAIELSRLGLDRFEPADLRLMQIIAAQASVAIVNARQVEELERRSAEMERQLATQRQLLTISEGLLKTRDPSGVFEAIADTLSEVVPYDTLTIYLVDRAQEVLVPVLARDQYAEQILGSRMALGSGITGDVVVRGEAEIINDANRDPRVAHVPGTPEDEDESIIVVPLHSPTGVIGALNLYRLGAHFQPSELDLAKLYANHAAIALENAQVHAQLLHAARTDPLTGLRHQGGFREALDRALETSGQVGLLMVDLDNFKAYNDHHGHQAGDRLLQRLAERLTASVRSEDIVCRYGGDEFALILPDTDERGARAVARKLLAAVDAASDDPAVRVGASIGIAAHPVDAGRAADLVAIADTALYLAKQSGKGRTVAASDLPTHVRELRDVLERVMRDAQTGERRAYALVELVRPLHDVLRGLAPTLAESNERVARLCREAGPRLGIVGRHLEALEAAALVSDVGRLAADPAGEAQQGAVGFAHPVLAGRLLEAYPALAEVAELVRHHHERFDGAGYPDGLRGDELSPAVRVLTAVERYVALAWPHEGGTPLDPVAALAAVRAEAGGRLAPDGVEALALALVGAA
ncbi:MAG TPA: GAF domain-containing protein [Candidatus Limnocylindrales bacterium]|nr:GAF domain-containing protein [Candidatus Limnocylindrales bacterium]